MLLALYFRVVVTQFDAVMTRYGLQIIVAVLVILLAGTADLRAATTNEAPGFEEVYGLIRSNLSGITDAELNRAAVQGLVTALGAKVSLGPNPVTPASTDARPVSKVSVFEDEIAYLQVAHVSGNVAKEIAKEYEKLSATNKLKGLVIDLRYSDGADYQAAVSSADLFVSKARPLLDWGKGAVSSTEKANAIEVPVAVLVNNVTSGSAEALAALLRETSAGLILGGRTAGQAMIGKNFQLENGQQLYIATSPVTLGDGSALPSDGIKPDIEVTVDPDSERAYYADAFLVMAGGAQTNLANGTNVAGRRVRFNEAELVREHREGRGRDDETEIRPVRDVQPDRPVVSDPVLARAVDLLKGLAVVRQFRS